MAILCPRLTDAKDKAQKETERSVLILEKKVPCFRQRV